MVNRKNKFMKSLTLNVMSRLIILNNLPEQGSVVEMVAKRNIIKKVDFTSEELDQLKFETSNDRLIWQGNIVVEIEFSDSEISLLKTVVDKLDASGSITDATLDFAETVLNS